MPYATHSGVRTYYEVEGRGAPLMLHIGFLGRLDDWRRNDTPYAAALNERYRLILVDPRGQGRSDKRLEPTAYTKRRRARDMVAVLDDLGIARTHFWRYSLGGYVGFALAAHAPERLISLIAGGAHPFVEATDPTRHVFYKWLQGGIDHFVASYEDAYAPLPAEARKRWLAEDPAALSAAWLAPDQAVDLDSALPGMHVPALLYVGGEDDPGPVERAASIMPDATFLRLDGLNHGQAFRRSDLVLPHAHAFLHRVTGSP